MITPLQIILQRTTSPTFVNFTPGSWKVRITAVK